MRACQITTDFGIENVRLNRIEPADPAPGQVAIRVGAVSLNFRDLLVVRGLYSKKLPLPLTICSDCAGEVTATGAGVARVKAGDKVAVAFMPGWISGEANEAKARTALGAFAPGVLATQVLFPEEAVVRIPAHLTLAEASTLPCAAVTAWNALVGAGRIKAGDAVLVQGSGGVSVFALQIARASGARVIATTSSDEKAERLKALGASNVINYRTTPDWEETVRKLTGGGVDHVVEIGGAATFAKSVRAARMGGRIAVIGNRAEGGGEVNLTSVLMKSICVQGVFVGSRDMFEEMNRAITVSHLQPVVDRVFGFDEVPAALDYFAKGAHFGKVVIRVTE